MYLPTFYYLSLASFCTRPRIRLSCFFPFTYKNASLCTYMSRDINYKLHTMIKYLAKKLSLYFELNTSFPIIRSEIRLNYLWLKINTPAISHAIHSKFTKEMINEKAPIRTVSYFNIYRNSYGSPQWLVRMNIVHNTHRPWNIHAG